MQGHVRAGCLRQGEREEERRERECVRQTEGNGKWKMCGNAAQKGIRKRVRRVLQRELERWQKIKREGKAETRKDREKERDR